MWNLFGSFMEPFSYVDGDAAMCSVTQAFLEIIINLQFQLVETLWMSFWRKVHTGNFERYRRAAVCFLYFLMHLY